MENLKEICARNNVPCIDLAMKMPKDSKYYYDHSHFTNEGAEVVSAIVALHLEAVISKKFPGYANHSK